MFNSVLKDQTMICQENCKITISIILGKALEKQYAILWELFSAQQNLLCYIKLKGKNTFQMLVLPIIHVRMFQ